MAHATPGPAVLEAAHKSVAQTIYDVRWVPGTARFVALGSQPRGTGTLQLWELDGAELSQSEGEERGAGIKCGCFGAGSPRRLAVGAFGGQLQIVDAERLGASAAGDSAAAGCSSTVFRVQAHQGIVNSLDVFGGSDQAGPPLIATAGQDGGVRVWDARQPAAPAAAFLPAPGAAAPDAWCVAVGNAHAEGQACVLAGYAGGELRLLDLAAGRVRWETNVGAGVCGVQFDRRNIAMNKFVATCLESRLCLYDARTQHPSEGFAGSCEALPGRDATLWAARHLPQNRDVFMVTGGDGSLSLLKYRYPDQRSVEDRETGEARGVVGTAQLLCEHTIDTQQPVAGFDWSADKPGAWVAAAFDQTLRVGVVSRASTL